VVCLNAVPLLLAGRIPKWPTGADCKSAGLRLHWFESSSYHHFNKSAENRFCVVFLQAFPSRRGTVKQHQLNSLTPENAYIFRITHISNVPWILDHGLHCRNSGTFDPNYQEIGNPELIGKRASRVVPIAPGGTLSDYIPFYFTPYSPMLLNIKTGHGGVKQQTMNDIVILVSSLRALAAQAISFVFTDRHAYLQTAEFHSDLARLDCIPWNLLQNRDFRREPERPDKMERYQAEALIYQQLPIRKLAGIICYGGTQQSQLDGQIAKRQQTLKVAARPSWYFK
jgi:hypothetical protein